MVIRLGRKTIGDGRTCFLIAEAGVNHDGRLDRALRLVDVAANAGADAVKFQTFRADALAAACAPQAAYQNRAAAARSQRDMLRRLELNEAAHRALIARCRKRAILFLSTPFDEESADLLERLDVPAFKLPSGELTNLPLLSHVARKRRPMLVSTGMATLAEVRAAVRVIRRAGNPPLALLHCVSSYPAEPAWSNLRAMATLRHAFRVPTGYSDHALGPEVSLAAAALGAAVLEKHFTLDKNRPGPDHAMSMSPAELKAWVRSVRAVESALGDGLKRPVPPEIPIARAARKSLVAARPIALGERLTAGAVTRKRPGTGLPPAALTGLLGRRALRDIPADALLSRRLFS